MFGLQRGCCWKWAHSKTAPCSSGTGRLCNYLLHLHGLSEAIVQPSRFFTSGWRSENFQASSLLTALRIPCCIVSFEKSFQSQLNSFFVSHVAVQAVYHPCTYLYNKSQSWYLWALLYASLVCRLFHGSAVNLWHLSWLADNEEMMTHVASVACRWQSRVGCKHSWKQSSLDLRRNRACFLSQSWGELPWEWFDMLLQKLSNYQQHMYNSNFLWTAPHPFISKLLVCIKPDWLAENPEIIERAGSAPSFISSSKMNLAPRHSTHQAFYGELHPTHKFDLGLCMLL